MGPGPCQRMTWLFILTPGLHTGASLPRDPPLTAAPRHPSRSGGWRWGQCHRHQSLGKHVSDGWYCSSGFLWLFIILRKSEYRQTLLTGLVLGRVRSWAAPPQHSGRGRTCCTGPRCPSRCTPAALSSPPDYINRNVIQAAKNLLYLTSRIPNTNATKWPKTTVICR